MIQHQVIQAKGTSPSQANFQLLSIKYHLLNIRKQDSEPYQGNAEGNTNTREFMLVSPKFQQH